MATAGGEKGAGAVEVDPVTVVKISFGAAADDGGQMENGIGIRAQQRINGFFVVQIALDIFETRVGISRKNHIEKGDLGNWLLPAFGVRQAAFFMQRLGQPITQKTAATCDCNFHDALLINGLLQHCRNARAVRRVPHAVKRKRVVVPDRLARARIEMRKRLRHRAH